MALSPSSVLHYWTARYGSVPVIGGKPTHSRSTAGSWLDQRGVLQSAIINTPRFQWADLDGSGQRRQVLRLEMARTNQILYSSDLTNAAWSKANCTIAAGVPDPMGGTNACTVTATGANATTDQTLSAGSSLVRFNSVWLRRRTGTGTVRIVSPDGVAYIAVVLTSSWQRFIIPGIASTVREGGINIVTSGDAVDHYGFQLEDGVCATSEIPTTSVAVTRAADSLYWDYIPPPQAMALYARWIDRGGMVGSVLSFGNAGGSNPELFVQNSAGRYKAYQNGVTSTPTSSPSNDDLVEYAFTMDAGGVVTGIISVNGAAVAAGAPSSGSTPPTAWPDTKLWLNSEGTLSPGVRDWGEVKVVKLGDVVASTAQGIMDELRAFELGPNGAQI